MRHLLLLRRGMQFILVSVGIVVLTSFSIDATDTLRQSNTALSIFASRATTPHCPQGMTLVTQRESSFCIDSYESGVGSECIVPEPQSPGETALNAVDADCLAVSAAGVLPWRFVTVQQAEQLCARSGKHLPTAEEWYQAALGTVDSASCNLRGDLERTGNYLECRSGSGAYDMIGNVWEFVQGEVTAGTFDGKSVPVSGYVASVDTAGLPRASTNTPQILFNDDYVWSTGTGTYALMRGGFYGSADDGGLYAVHAMIGREFNSGAIGFRCAKRL